jgi:hypothetical protein
MMKKRSKKPPALSPVAGMEGQGPSTRVTGREKKTEANFLTFMKTQAGPDLSFWNDKLGYNGPNDFKMSKPQVKVQPKAKAPPKKSLKGSGDPVVPQELVPPLDPNDEDCPCIQAAKAAQALKDAVAGFHFWTNSPQKSWDQFGTCDLNDLEEDAAEEEKDEEGEGRGEDEDEGQDQEQEMAPDTDEIQDPNPRKVSRGSKDRGGRHLSAQFDEETKKLTQAAGLDLSKYSDAGVNVMIRGVKGPEPKDLKNDKKTKITQKVDLTLLPETMTAEELRAQGGKRDTILILRPPGLPDEDEKEPEAIKTVKKAPEAPFELLVEVWNIN